MSTDEPITAQDTELAQGIYEAFFERNKDGIQYVDIPARIYYISRSHTLRGPIPPGVSIEHTGLEGNRPMYNSKGFKNYPRRKTGGSHSKRRRQ